MSVSFEIGSDFLDDQAVPLSLDDVRYGFVRGWLHPDTVIKWAARQRDSGQQHVAVTRIASIAPDDVRQLQEVLKTEVPVDATAAEAESKRKWLYLQLAAAYMRRTDLPDPLGVVEKIYADFDYPPKIRGLVRYMPLDVGEKAGEAEIVERWRQYLREERAALTSGQPSG
jgi:hypothetical protein